MTTQIIFSTKDWSIPRNMPSEDSIVRAAIIKQSISPVIIAEVASSIQREMVLNEFCNNTGIPIGEIQAEKGVPLNHSQNLGAIVIGQALQYIIQRCRPCYLYRHKTIRFHYRFKTLFQNPMLNF